MSHRAAHGLDPKDNWDTELKKKNKTLLVMQDTCIHRVGTTLEIGKMVWPMDKR